MTTVSHIANVEFRTELHFGLKPFNGFLLLFASAAVYAQVGITQLPESYRTPLSDMVYDDMQEWRASPEDDNPWREHEGEATIKTGNRIKFFPQYNYDDLQNPISSSLLQNENEIERPVSNILELSF